MIQWFRNRKPELQPVPQPIEQAQKSLAFNALCHQFPAREKYRVLDLGPATARNVEFFGRIRCRLHIEDLFNTLVSFDYFSASGRASNDAVLSYLMPFPRNTRFDAVLAWDLPNYLDRDILRQVMQHIARYCGKGTVLFAWVSTNRYVPETPLRFEIMDEETLQCTGETAVLRAAPNYDAPEMPRLFPGFRICNSFALRNGYREYLLIFE